ncbi:MAG TPA: hypothetical protein C5S50_01965 [Methanosarcinaceae archaeon]|nr:hypothetical protein [Methanosarcinaceae archaeon]
MFQVTITPTAGKRLIARAITQHADVNKALSSGTVVIIAGTTNGYVAEEILELTNQNNGFVRKRFFRGITLPSNIPTTGIGRLSDESGFPGDVVLVNGKWQKGKTVFDVIDDLKEGDIILKGANSVDLKEKKAAILIGHPKGGTIAISIQAVIGRRVRIMIPVGLEKRITGNLDNLAKRLNAPGSTGPRLYPVLGDIITELEAVFLLSGANATLIAGGGVCGAEGSIWLAIDGQPDELKSIKDIIESIQNEPAFVL